MGWKHISNFALKTREWPSSDDKTYLFWEKQISEQLCQQTFWPTSIGSENIHSMCYRDRNRSE